VKQCSTVSVACASDEVCLVCTCILILQPFGVLHGGITAFLAENLSSMGASVVSRWARVAGIDLNVNHLLSASIGETVHVDATPLRAGKRVQVSNQFSFNVLIASDF
jgi:uncharacterized protein (TIGR00369 family)